MKVSGTLPKDDRNGLYVLDGPMLREPGTKHVIVALVDAKEITTDVDTGTERVTLRFHAIEGVRRDTEAGRELRAIWRRLWEDRTGNASLPLDIQGENDPDPDDPVVD